MTAGRALRVLHEQVDARVRALTSAHPGWPCARGCDACCRRLARVPELAKCEWELLEPAVRALPSPERESCLERAAALRDDGPVQCPLLDPDAGVCLVYAARPLACRSYGFYVERDHDAWCERVAAHVAHERERLVFGNHAALDRELQQIDGEPRSLKTWLATLRDD
jgi:Fe-S-cluster containining protein